MFRIRPPIRAFRAPLRPSQTSPRCLRDHTSFRTYKQQRFGRGPQYKRFGSASGGIADLFFRWAARPTFYRDVGIITAGTGGVYVYNLEQVPVSGRRRFNIISPGLEERLGKSTVDQVKEQYEGQFLTDHDPRVRQVKHCSRYCTPHSVRSLPSPICSSANNTTTVNEYPKPPWYSLA